ncbi:hypothetical protein VF14_18235 [Nostoc linckia z18]|uniref:Uncharacterized protein n=2 Tax=Nostoc linckia TaxID=92942 RepID=A0A9Q5Z572_NOSLI|nr:hypothetical protein [Nostoc linckia]PHJ80059.1 hypothetical protein VF04_38065 [Nostoc linckia z7]PHJ81987.1 hypothetical protein VF07_29295 [Nostoc linckia z6]PHJ94024.1 hypothetical protein VF08_34405 [Nostoc linckia z8]PHK05054.1 hypothetical protein VF10_38020 [Nostoc linckia z13]PHK09331.1 hypothetical protein VF09_16070 [Nostoc linckia z9]
MSLPDDSGDQLTNEIMDAIRDCLAYDPECEDLLYTLLDDTLTVDEFDDALYTAVFNAVRAHQQAQQQ